MDKRKNIKKQTSLDSDMLYEYLGFNPDTGIFTWKKRRWRSAKGVAGCKTKKGYVVIVINDIQYQAHRLAWLYHYGDWPKLELDHINGKRDDNRICNLREATQSQNNANMKAKPHNRIGLKGVRQRGKVYEASIIKDGKYYYLGTHKTATAASSAYFLKSKELSGEFARAK